MWLLVLFLFQDPQTMEPEPINARLFLQSGDKLDLIDVKVKGSQPYVFEFYADGETSMISLLRVARITKLDTNSFEVLLDDGTLMVGRITPMSLIGQDLADPKREPNFYDIYQLARVHIIAGSQLRSCFKGHYEEYTPHPFCPVCGNELAIGPYMDDAPDGPQSRYPFHQLRLNGRDPSSRN